MLSLPDSQDPVAEDVFHTPQENSSPPISCHQRRSATDCSDLLLFITLSMLTLGCRGRSLLIWGGIRT
ncbi:hypothetical protein ACSQ67_007400 [Phaseolus vulgaris]